MHNVLTAADGTVFSTTGLTGSDSFNNLLEISPNITDEGGNRAKLVAAYRALSSSFKIGDDIISGGEGATARSGATKVYIGSGTFFSIRGVSHVATGSSIRIYTFTPNTPFEFSGPRSHLFGTTSPGVVRQGIHTDLSVGDLLESGGALQTIRRVSIESDTTRYFVDDYSIFEGATSVSGRIAAAQTIVQNVWYSRNENNTGGLSVLDRLSEDTVATQALAAAQGRLTSLEARTTTTGNPGLVTGAQRNSINDFAVNPAFTTRRQRQVQTAMVRLLGNRELGDTFADTFPIDNPIEIGAQVNVQSDWDLESFACFDAITGERLSQFTDEASCVLIGRCTASNLVSGGVVETRAECEARVGGSVTFNPNIWRDITNDDGYILNRPTTSELGGFENANALLELDSAGRISPTAFGTVNLAATETYTNITFRNQSVRRAWKQGDVAIIVGISGLSLTTDSASFTEGGTTLTILSLGSGDLPDRGDIVIVNGSNIKTITYRFNSKTENRIDGELINVTNVLSGTDIDSDTFSSTDVADFITTPGTTVSVQTGTFAYQGLDQTVAAATVTAQWIEIATPTGTVTSVSGKVGVVTLTTGDIANLNNRLGTLDSSTSSNTADITTNNVTIGDAGTIGVFTDSGTVYTETFAGSGIYVDSNGVVFTGTLPTTFTTPSANSSGVIGRAAILERGITTNVNDISTNAVNIGVDGVAGVFTVSSITYTETFAGSSIYLDSGGDEFTGTFPTTFDTDPVSPSGVTGRVGTTERDIITNAGNISINRADIGTGTAGVFTDNNTVYTETAVGSGTYADTLGNPLSPTGATVFDITPVSASGLTNEIAGKQDTLDFIVTQSDFNNKQDKLDAGTNVSASELALGRISVENTSGIQVTAFKFERISGDEIKITQYVNGETIDPSDHNGTTIIYVDGLDTELYNIAGTCVVDGSVVNTITTGQECKQTNGLWTINNGPAILQRIT